MKKLIVAFVALAIAGASVQKAAAGGWGGCGGCNNGWQIAAAAIGGLAAGVAVGSAVAPRPVYYAAPAPAYYPAPGYGYTYYAPAPQPAVVYAAPAPVVYAPVYRPVYAAPPVVSVRVGYGGYGGYYYRRW
jgi:hypothetical protein